MKKGTKITLGVIGGIIAAILIVAAIIVIPLYKAYRKSFDPNTKVIDQTLVFTIDTGDDPDISEINPEDWDPDADPDDPDLTGEISTDPVIITDGPDNTSSPDVTTGGPEVSSEITTDTPTVPEPTTAAPEPKTDPVVTTKAATTPKVTTPVSTPEPHEVVTKGILKVEQKDPDIENILLCGLDTRDASSFSGRSDGMIVLSFNKKTGEVRLVSILRDTYVPIYGTTQKNKINAAYNYGADCAINTINGFFDLDIQKYVTINFNGVSVMIEKCGGVDIELSTAEYNYITKETGRAPQKLENGKYHLDGQAAKIYMSIRKGDGITRGDWGRVDRQKQLLVALYQKLVTECTPTEIYDLIKTGFAYVRTNIPLSYLLSLASSVLEFGTNLKIEQASVPCSGSWYYGTTSAGASIIALYSTDKKNGQQMNVDYLKEYIWGKK